MCPSAPGRSPPSPGPTWPLEPLPPGPDAPDGPDAPPDPCAPLSLWLEGLLKPPLKKEEKIPLKKEARDLLCGGGGGGEAGPDSGDWGELSRLTLEKGDVRLSGDDSLDAAPVLLASEGPGFLIGISTYRHQFYLFSSS